MGSDDEQDTSRGIRLYMISKRRLRNSVSTTQRPVTTSGRTSTALSSMSRRSISVNLRSPIRLKRIKMWPLALSWVGTDCEVGS